MESAQRLDQHFFRFKIWFWGLLIAQLLCYASYAADTTTQDERFLYLILLLLSLVVSCVVYGYFAYAFSGKKSKIAYAVMPLGGMLGPIIFIIGYFMIRAEWKSAKALLVKV